MLNFFRKNAVYIAVGIVIFFVGTLFTGMFFLRGLSDQKAATTSQVDTAQVLAVIGDVKVPTKTYYSQLQKTINQLGANGQNLNRLDPELVELVKYRSYQSALEYAFLLHGADTNKIDVSKSDLKLALADVYARYNVEDKKALKKLLKDNGATYSDFIADLKNEVRARKMSNMLIGSISVTDQDVENQFVTRLVQQILVRPNVAKDSKPDVIEAAYADALTRAESVVEKVQKGLAFDDAVAQFSDDEKTKANKGELGWIRMGMVHPVVERTVFSLDTNEISLPVRSPQGYHVFRVKDQKVTPKPENFDQEKAKKALFSQKQQRVMVQFANSIRQNQEDRIFDASLVAVKAKYEGRYQDAIGAYQSIVSKVPSDPVPHYLLSRVYLKMESYKEAKEELVKADILVDMNDQVFLPQLHVELAKLHKQSKQYSLMKTQLDKAITRAGDDMGLNKYLKSVFTDLDDKKRAAIVAKKIKALEAAQKEAKLQEENIPTTSSIE